MKRIAPFITLARPQQWLKNGFVFVGLFFAHAWTVPDLVRDVLVLFTAFCLVSSAVYVFNDMMDRDADRAHPGKRSRPVASGQVRPGIALAFSFILGAAGLVLASSVSIAALGFVSAYIAIIVEHLNAGVREVAVERIRNL